jgi:hypothetical protein
MTTQHVHVYGLEPQNGEARFVCACGHRKDLQTRGSKERQRIWSLISESAESIEELRDALITAGNDPQALEQVYFDYVMHPISERLVPWE